MKHIEDIMFGKKKKSEKILEVRKEVKKAREYKNKRETAPCENRPGRTQTASLRGMLWAPSTQCLQKCSGLLRDGHSLNTRYYVFCLCNWEIDILWSVSIFGKQGTMRGLEQHFPHFLQHKSFLLACDLPCKTAHF